MKNIKTLVLSIALLTTCAFQLQAGKLHDLINTGKTEEAIELLNSTKIDLEQLDNKGYTPFLLACRKNDIPLAKLLIEKGANINASCTTGPNAGATPLLYVCHNNNFKFAKQLIEKGANVNASLLSTGPDAGGTSLIYACTHNNFELAKLLIEKGANVNASLSTGPDAGGTSLIYACVHDNFELAKLLIEKGANVNTSRIIGSNAGATPLLFACHHNNFELAKLLIEKGANVNASVLNDPNAGATSLLYACYNNNFELAKLLIEKGANINASVLNGPIAHKTPLDFIFTTWKTNDFINKIIPLKNNKIGGKEDCFLQKISPLIARKYYPKAGLIQEIDLLPLKSSDINDNFEELINICKAFMHHFFTTPHIALMLQDPLSKEANKLSQTICGITPFEWVLKNRFKITEENLTFLCRLLNFAKVASKKYHPKNNVDEEEQLFNERYGKFNDLTIRFNKLTTPTNKALTFGKKTTALKNKNHPNSGL
ncbi:TPA: hypothetical protein DDZ86_04685 [Candidatus Dependentiae bacterium]|nr:hypothetical protein [Candidatus Dependentiae bacterium]